MRRQSTGVRSELQARVSHESRGPERRVGMGRVSEEGQLRLRQRLGDRRPSASALERSLEHFRGDPGVHQAETKEQRTPRTRRQDGPGRPYGLITSRDGCPGAEAERRAHK